MRHLISLKEQTKGEILEILELAKKVKLESKAGKITNYLENKTLVMLFQKTSTRTRLSFEAGMTQLGGHGIYLDSRNTQLGLSDFRDEIRAIMRFGDVLMFRAIRASDVILSASFNRIPVIDACSEKYHPCQALSDLLTMTEQMPLDKIKKVAWLGIENNVMNTLMMVCVKLGIKFYIAAGEVDSSSVDNEINEIARKSGLVERTTVENAMKNADFVHTDTWMNMEFFENGKVKEEFRQQYEQRKKSLLPYQLSADKVNKYCPNAKIMHCMPCHTGYEISRDAIDHKNSIIFDQAENRMHMQKAIIMWLLGMPSRAI